MNLIPRLVLAICFSLTNSFSEAESSTLLEEVRERRRQIDEQLPIQKVNAEELDTIFKNIFDQTRLERIFKWLDTPLPNVSDLIRALDEDDLVDSELTISEIRNLISKFKNLAIERINLRKKHLDIQKRTLRTEVEDRDSILSRITEEIDRKKKELAEALLAALVLALESDFRFAVGGIRSEIDSIRNTRMQLATHLSEEDLLVPVLSNELVDSFYSREDYLALTILIDSYSYLKRLRHSPIQSWTSDRTEMEEMKRRGFGLGDFFLRLFSDQGALKHRRESNINTRLPPTMEVVIPKEIRFSPSGDTFTVQYHAFVSGTTKSENGAFVWNQEKKKLEPIPDTEEVYRHEVSSAGFTQNGKISAALADFADRSNFYYLGPNKKDHREFREYLSDNFFSLTLSPDNQWVARLSGKDGEQHKRWTSSTDLKVELFNTQTGLHLSHNIYYTPETFRFRPPPLLFSPDGKFLTIVCPNVKIIVLEVPTLVEVSTLYEKVSLASFSYDGKLIATDDRDTGVVKLWNTVTREEIHSFESPKMKVTENPT